MIKFSESKTENSKLSVKCNTCKRDTYHTVVRAVDYKLTYEAEPEHVVENGLGLNGTAQIIVCDGCNTVSFRDKYFFSEEPGPNVSIYPPREKQSAIDKLYLRDEIYAVPRIVKTIYRETLSAIERDSPTLAGMGIRGIIEAICNEKKAKGKTLYDKLNNLVDISLLTRNGAKILHSIRLLCNEVVHGMKAPSSEQIIAAMKVIDHLLLGVYVLPHEAAVFPKAGTKRVKISKRKI